MTHDITKLGALASLGEFFPCGSRVTCMPPPTDTDEDWLVLVEDMESFRFAVLAQGFEIGGSLFLDAEAPLDAEDRFSSYSLGEVNIIATEDPTFFFKFKVATSVAKRLNLLDKADRIALFQAVLYGNPCNHTE